MYVLKSIRKPWKLIITIKVKCGTQVQRLLQPQTHKLICKPSPPKLKVGPFTYWKASESPLMLLSQWFYQNLLQSKLRDFGTMLLWIITLPIITLADKILRLLTHPSF